MLVSNILFDRAAAFDMTASVYDSVSLTWDGRDTDPYLAGEYKVVLQLVGVLPHGKTAKKLVDRAIDNCEGTDCAKLFQSQVSQLSARVTTTQAFRTCAKRSTTTNCALKPLTNGRRSTTRFSKWRAITCTG